VGVAKGVTLIGVKVLSNAGSGTVAGVVDGMDWALQRFQGSNRPAVISMSIGTASESSAMNTGIKNCVDNGLTFVAAAGNDSSNACDSSPGSSADAIIVGATSSNDNKASFSNYGSCLDLFAPGVSIYSANNDNNSGLVAYSGTSMATPHVAGEVARYLEAHPSATPEEVKVDLLASATSGVVGNQGTGSPNLLLRIENASLEPVNPPTDAPNKSPSPPEEQQPPPQCAPRNAQCSADADCCSQKCRGGNDRTCKGGRRLRQRSKHNKRD